MRRRIMKDTMKSFKKLYAIGFISIIMLVYTEHFASVPAAGGNIPGYALIQAGDVQNSALFSIGQYGDGCYPTVYFTSAPQNQSNNRIQSKIAVFEKEYGFNVDTWLYVHNGSLPTKLGSIALGQRETEHDFSGWTRNEIKGYSGWYTQKYTGDGEAGVAINTNGEISYVAYFFENQPVSFGPDMLEYLYAKYKDLFYEQVTQKNRDYYRFVDLMKASGTLRSLWFEFLDNKNFQVTLSYEPLTQKLASAIEEKMNQNLKNKVKPYWIPYANKTLDTESIANMIQNTIQKQYPDVLVRLKAEERTVHFYFNNQKIVDDEAYYQRLISIGIRMADLAKIMHRYEANWIGSKVLFTYGDKVWAWIYTDDCEEAALIEDMEEKGQYLGQKIHWTLK
jgi:hypothetical protein